MVGDAPGFVLLVSLSFYGLFMVTVEVSGVSKLWESMIFGWKPKPCEQNWRFNWKGRIYVLCNGKYLKIFT